MRLPGHIVLGGVAAVALLPFWGIPQSLLFWASAVLIDCDHYLDYLWKTKGKDWSPRRMFRYYDAMMKSEPDRRNLGFSLMHTAEMFILVYLLALFVSYWFFMTILAGMLFHLLTDMVWLGSKNSFFIRAYSIAEYHVRKRNKLRNGIDVQEFFNEMFDKSNKF